MEAKTLFWLIIIVCCALIIAKNHIQNILEEKFLLKIKNGTYIKSIIGIGLILILYVGCQDASYKNSIENPSNSSNNYSAVYTAYETAKKAVKKELKAPSTASFAEMTDSEAKCKVNDDGSVIIRSYVDAENSFGAKIRTHFQCTVKYGEVSDLTTW
ncbi:hypothetical protein [Bacteroides sp.]|uniref:hypothetical protein n=1 Tax=Bacteroides sp. TaxID=29523 RepID=UPI002617B1B5|nr:hypothetical protein [Bacteroides sp.]